MFKYIHSGFVDADMVEKYSENRGKFISKGKGNDFKLAVKQMDEYISDPTVLHHFSAFCLITNYTFDFEFPLSEISCSCILERNCQITDQN